jgi:predicted phage-related endonuclease
MIDVNTSTELAVMPEAEPDRKLYVGGSDIAAIIGVGYEGNTALSTYLAKIGELNEPMSDNQRRFLNRRKRWEEPITQMLEEEFEAKIVGRNRRYKDPEHAFFASEIDFDWLDHEGQTQNGEIKTVSPFVYGSEASGWGEPGTGDLPTYIAAQCMWGLGVTGRSTCILAAMVGLDAMYFYRVDRDDDAIAYMREAARLFWLDHVQKREPPPPMGLQDVERIALRLTGRPVEVSEAMAQKVDKMCAIRAYQKKLEERYEKLTVELCDHVRQQWGMTEEKIFTEFPPENARITYKGKKIASWHRQRATSLDQAQLKIDHPEIIFEYTRERHQRVLRLAKSRKANKVTLLGF